MAVVETFRTPDRMEGGSVTEATARCGLLAVVVLGTALRAVHLGRGFYDDEVFDLFVAAHPIKAIPSLVAADYHPPLYFFLLHFWTLVSHSEVWLRLPSVAFGVATIVMTFVLVSRVMSRDIALLAALLVALSPINIEASGGVKMYALLSFLSVTLVWTAQRLTEGHRRWWAAYGALALCTLYTHNLGSFVVAGTALWTMVASWRDGWSLRAWALVHGVIAAVYFPWIPVALHQAARGPHAALWWVMPPTTLRAWSALWYDLTASSLPVSDSVRVKLTIPLFLLLLLGIAALRRRKAAAPSLLALGGAPIVLAAALGVMGFPVFVSRALISVSLAFCILAAAGLISLATIPRRVLGAMALGLVALATAGQMRAPTEDWRAVARYLEPRVVAGEMVVAPTGFLAAALRYYWSSATPVRAWATVGADDVKQATGVWVVEKSLFVLRRQTYPSALCHAMGDPAIVAVGTVLVLHYRGRGGTKGCSDVDRVGRSMVAPLDAAVR